MPSALPTPGRQVEGGLAGRAQARQAAAGFRLGACVIEKSMSTVLAAIVCFLHDPDGFVRANRSITNDVYQRR